MGLDCTKAQNLLHSIRDIQIENSANATVLARNCVMLPHDFELRNEYSLITDNLCYVNGMVRFEYKSWDGVIRRVEGYVCLVDSNDDIGLEVKLWTEKNEMLMVYFSSTFGINVIPLASDYKSGVENDMQGVYPQLPNSPL